MDSTVFVSRAIEAFESKRMERAGYRAHITSLGQDLLTKILCLKVLSSSVRHSGMH
jgi:hypothetical protein